MIMSPRCCVSVAIMIGLNSLSIVFCPVPFQRPALAAEPAATATNAADLYAKAAKLISVDSPANSNLEYPAYPPFGPKWESLAQAAWENNAAARQFAREARGTAQVMRLAKKDYAFLNLGKQLANELGDAALYQHLRGGDTPAVETVRDIMHFAKLLRKDAGDDEARVLVGVGVNALAMDRLLLIASNATLTADDKDVRALPVASVRKLIAELLEQEDPEDCLKQLYGKNYEGFQPDPARGPVDITTILEHLRRSNAERTFAAMSLACHVFRFEKGRWPANAAEMVPAYLPRVPIDPWSKDKESFGYMVIKAALPGGVDRPLVYSRCESHDGLFYRTDRPQYRFYLGDGSGGPASRQKRGGQFRDVVLWVPAVGVKDPPPVRLLP